ncbi:helix-turn-helix transcriptional regulator [Glutamicibacter sp.]|uniref:helix-turn-helix transcriptional regulator n=1 Tax=Glutamicibacter sp. TaxID=1931995 RepID=UPI0028BE2C09|nr:helix-turn-helix transcriptional regulator [Glutamicibacter sp.]
MDADSLLLISQQLASLADDLRHRPGNGATPAKEIEGLSLRLIHTRRDLIDTFNDMQDRAVYSIDALDCGAHSNNSEAQSRSQPAALKRGVRFRVVYDPLVFEHEEFTRAMLEAVRQGEQARVSTNVTTRILIRDREEFIIHSTPHSGAEHLAVQMTSPVLAPFINDAFAKVWDNALQVSNRKFESGTLLEDDEVQILRLLAAGQKDESVARALGVSVRTVQRKIQNLQRNFGAASRFQLGAISAQHLIVEN